MGDGAREGDKSLKGGDNAALAEFPIEGGKLFKKLLFPFFIGLFNPGFMDKKLDILPKNVQEMIYAGEALSGLTLDVLMKFPGITEYIGEGDGAFGSLGGRGDLRHGREDPKGLTLRVGNEFFIYGQFH